MKKSLIAFLALTLGLCASAQETVTTLRQIVNLWEDQPEELTEDQEFTYQGKAAVIMITQGAILLNDESGSLLLNVSNYEDVPYTIGQCVTSFEGQVYCHGICGNNALGKANLATLQFTDEVEAVEPILGDPDKGFYSYVDKYVRFDNVTVVSPGDGWAATADLRLHNGKQAGVLKSSPVLPEIGTAYSYVICVPIYYAADPIDMVYCVELGTPSGITDIVVDDPQCTLYDLNGRESVNPGPGIYLIKSGQQATKVLIK